ncbi:putative lipid-transfer protein DIR1 [Rhododendron vialii]|uniref:putative lipid-transfer protein DIR1 n=1 Tax=Rhododendron vialii TaxID=182163 RepID=UPI0026604B1C|nr:putative lipid-transfer protein DIR1 [Rhododendron vialii]
MEIIGRKLLAVVAAAAVIVAVFGGSEALELCNMNEDGLTACKPSVTTPNPVDPTPPCCEALSAANLTCLCGYRHSFVLPSLGIDPDLAMALPAKCNLTPPPNC